MKSTRKLRREKGSWKVNNGSRVAGVTFATQRKGLAWRRTTLLVFPARSGTNLGRGYIIDGGVELWRDIKVIIIIILEDWIMGEYRFFPCCGLIVSLFVEVVSCEVEVLWSTSSDIYLPCGVEVTLCQFDRHIPENSINYILY